MDDIRVNDGGGFYDINGMFDSLIVDIDNQLKALFCGERVSFCGGMVAMINKVSAMKKGVNDEIEGLRKQIKELERKGVERDAAGSVHNTLDGAVGSREERLRDVIFAEGGGLEPDPDHAGA